MKNKKAEKTVTENLFYLIIVIAVIAIVSVGFFVLNIPEKIKSLFPNFFNQDDEIPPDEIIGDSILESPEKIIFQFQDGTREKNLYYHCSRSRGWSLYLEKTWLKVENIESFYKFKEFNKKNQEFIKSLGGKTCEEGLEILVLRTKNNNEGVLWFNSELTARVGKDYKRYANKDEELNNVKRVIKQLNKLASGE